MTPDACKCSGCWDLLPDPHAEHVARLEADGDVYPKPDSA